MLFYLLQLGYGGSNSSGGESSCDERSGRRRIPRSASDPDCTTSSSEQSCDTVIFLGAGGASNRGNGAGTISISDKELTDVESPSTSQRASLGKIHTPTHQPVMGTARISGRDTASGSTSSPQHLSQQKIISTSYRQPTSGSQPMFPDSPNHHPMHWQGQSDLTAKEQWVDGPSAPATVHHWIDQPKKRDTSLLDPLKHEFIKQWVFLQEQERRQEIKLENTSKNFYPGSPGHLSRLKQPIAPSYSTEFEMDATSEHSMETGSEPMDAIETKDASMQIEERDIDMEMGRPFSESTDVDASFLWSSSAEPEIRFLEDIAEVEEENLSETRSHHSSLHDQIMESLNYRNEAMAHMDSNFFFEEPRGGSSSFFSKQSSSIEEHPLRILSKERMDTKSDSFSFTSENIENISLPGTDQLEEDLPTDEELERAMQASLTSIRSHEILEKLKAESKSKKCSTISENVALMEMYGKKMERDNSTDKNLNPKHSSKIFTSLSTRSDPEGVEKGPKKSEPGLVKGLGQAPPAPAVVVIVNKAKENQSSLISEKLHHPTVPALPKQVQNEVTSRFNAAVMGTSSYFRSVSGSKDMNSSPKILVSSTKLKSPDKPEPSPLSSSLPRPSKLPSPAPAGTKVQPTVQLVQPKESGSKLKFKSSVKEPKLVKADKSKSTKVATGVTTNGTTGHDKDIKSQLNHNRPAETHGDKDKAAKVKISSGIRSPLMSFLKSPTKSKKPMTTTPGQRNSVGYDSGHDSGIVTIESPELLASPYSKVTKPRQSQRSSSGHGSDNSSAVSSDTGGNRMGPNKPKSAGGKLSLGFGSKSKNRESVGASSGYESGAGVRESETAATSPESASDTENTVHSTPSYKFIRKKSWLEGNQWRNMYLIVPF